MLIVLQQEKENKFTKELFDVVNVFQFVRANLVFLIFFLLVLLREYKRSF